MTERREGRKERESICWFVLLIAICWFSLMQEPAFPSCTQRVGVGVPTCGSLCFILTTLLIFVYKIYTYVCVFERQRDRHRVEGRSSIFWFILQTPAIVRTGQPEARNQEFIWVSHVDSRDSSSCCVSAAPWGVCSQTAGSEVKLELKSRVRCGVLSVPHPPQSFRLPLAFLETLFQHIL